MAEPTPNCTKEIESTQYGGDFTRLKIVIRHLPIDNTYCPLSAPYANSYAVDGNMKTNSSTWTLRSLVKNAHVQDSKTITKKTSFGI